MKLYHVLFFPLLYVAVIAAIAVAAGEQRDPQQVTVCHTNYETHCLWIDGHAEWR